MSEVSVVALEEAEVRLSFPYEPLIVQQVKQIPGRKYDPETHTWTVPKAQWKNLRKNLPDLKVTTSDPEELQALEALENFTYEAVTTTIEGFNGSLYPFQTVAVGFLVARETALLADDMGLGKAQPLDAKILTPSGWKTMGEMKAGDEIVNVDGGVSKVTGVYPQGVKTVFAVTFTDGATTECCEDHLWRVITPLRSPLRRNRGYPWRVKPLRKIRQNLADKNGNHMQFIPMVSPVRFHSALALPLHPYLLGVLLGDGGITHGAIVSAKDKELLTEITKLLPEGVKIKYTGQGVDYRLIAPGKHWNPVLTKLRELKLAGCHSKEKFIPKEYKTASVQSRIALLQGMLDTDGYSGGVIEYTTTSQQLAVDFIEIVQSLGGIARLKPKKTTWVYKGVRKYGKAFRITIKIPASIRPFRLSRKMATYTPPSKYLPVRAIDTVKSVGLKQCQCISTDAPDQLYVTDNYIVTHNTVSTIAALQQLRNQGKVKRALVFAPKSVIPQWMNEYKRFTGERGVDITGNKEARSFALAKAHGSFFVITNYETVLHDAGALSSLNPDAVVLDESQRIGNYKAKTTKAIKKFFHPRFRFSLSGTPIENAVAELHSIMDWIEPGVFGPWWLFKNKYVRYGGFKNKQIVGYCNLPRLHEQLKDWMLRRRKSEVLQDLPAVTVNTYYVQLGQEERKLYNKLREDLRNSYIMYKKSRGQKNSDILAALVYLRECCDHTALIADSGSGKAVSTKLQELHSILHDLGDEKVVIFTEFKRMLDLIARDLDCTYETLYGTMRQQERVRSIHRFKKEKCKVFLSTEAGGVGLNLQEASTIINVDCPWNPAKLQQRIGRLHRIGQKNTVTCINLVAKATIEERVLQVLSDKTDLFRKVVDGDFTGCTDYGDMWRILAEEFHVQQSMGDYFTGGDTGEYF